MSPHSRSRSATGVWIAICLVIALLGTVVISFFRGGTSDDTLLTVNGFTLTRTEFSSELQQIGANEAYVAARSRNGQQLKVFKDGSTTEFDSAFVVEFLNERVTFALAEAEVAKRGLIVTVEDRQRATAVIEANLESGATADLGTATASPGTTVASGPGTPPGSAPAASGASGNVLGAFGSYRDVLVNGVATLQVLQRDLVKGKTGDDALRQLYDGVRVQYATQACVRHILVNAGPPKVDANGNAATPSDDEYAAALAKVRELKAQLDGGADFATLAGQVSDDPSTKAKGGDLGCAPKGQYDAAFDDAAWAQPVGQVGEPIKSVYGYHLVLVTERRERTFDELKANLQSALDAQIQQELPDWIAGAAKAATVTIAAGVGRWNASTGVIEPPTSAGLGLVPEQGTGGTAPAGTGAGVPLAGGNGGASTTVPPAIASTAPTAATPTTGR